MKKLFDDNDKWTPEALEIERIALEEGIEKAFAHAKAEGYSLREVGHIVIHAATVAEMECLA